LLYDLVNQKDEVANAEVPPPERDKTVLKSVERETVVLNEIIEELPKKLETKTAASSKTFI